MFGRSELWVSVGFGFFGDADTGEGTEAHGVCECWRCGELDCSDLEYDFGVDGDYFEGSVDEESLDEFFGLLVYAKGDFPFDDACWEDDAVMVFVYSEGFAGEESEAE